MAGLLVFAISLACYLPTVMRDVGLWDVAEFQTVPHILGIAHPTGYPTYTLLGKLWLLLFPFGSVAWRMNLLSAVAASAAAGLLSGLATRYGGLLIGVVAGLTFAFAPYYWRVALRADPHTLNAFFIAGILALALAWEARRDFRLLAALAVWFGLGIGNHMLVVMVAPAIGLLVLSTLPGREFTWKRLGILAGLFVLGLSVYLYLPIRSAMGPPLNYAHPTTVERFFYLVSGAQFREGMTFLSAEGLVHFGATLKHYPGYLAAWYTVPGAIAIGGLSIAGFLLLLVTRPRVAVFLFLAFLVPFYAATNYTNADIHRYYFGPHAVLLLLAAAGFGFLGRIWGNWLEQRTRQERLRGSGSRSKAVIWGLLPRPAAIALVLLVFPVVMWRTAIPLMTYEGYNDSGRRFIEAIYRSAPRDAVILSWWGLSTALWYGRWVEGKRPDLLIVDDRNLLDDGWGGDPARVANAYSGKRPVITLYQDEKLTLLAGSGFLLEPFFDSQLGQIGNFVKVGGQQR